MHVVTIGDVVVDVVVAASRPPVTDGDVPARIEMGGGGQAANVAAWAAWLGASATVVGAVGDDPAGAILRSSLATLGVATAGPDVAGATGIVVSLVGADGTRTMLSDRGVAASLGAGHLREEWFTAADWLFVSGYGLLGDDGGRAALVAGRLAARAGARVAVDLSAATLVERCGPAEVRRRIGLLGAEVVFANEDEIAVAGDTGAATVVVKRGAAGHRVLHAGRAVDDGRVGGDGRVMGDGRVSGDGRVRGDGRLVSGPPPVDTTGAGDAFAAGWLVGGAALAGRAAARCVGRFGAMPPAEEGGRSAARQVPTGDSGDHT